VTASATDPTRRFTNRVANYRRWRPGYPDEVGEVLRACAGLAPDVQVADVGSGTGIASALLLRQGCTVFAVEPNDAMREAAEREFAGEPRFRSVRGTAEATTLPAGSMRLVLAAQAFHWFDPRATRLEFERILEPGGWAALLWNDRCPDADPFARAYEALLRDFGTDYEQVRHRAGARCDAPSLFQGPFQVRCFANAQAFDFEGLRGRLLSSSYAPAPGHPRHSDMLAALKRVFDAHELQGKVQLVYETLLFLGHISDQAVGKLPASRV
jgi:SAM-dependent methyltransferase